MPYPVNVTPYSRRVGLGQQQQSPPRRQPQAPARQQGQQPLPVVPTPGVEGIAGVNIPGMTAQEAVAAAAFTPVEIQAWRQQLQEAGFMPPQQQQNPIIGDGQTAPAGPVDARAVLTELAPPVRDVEDPTGRMFADFNGQAPGFGDWLQSVSGTPYTPTFAPVFPDATPYASGPPQANPSLLAAAQAYNLAVANPSQRGYEAMTARQQNLAEQGLQAASMFGFDGVPGSAQLAGQASDLADRRLEHEQEMDALNAFNTTIQGLMQTQGTPFEHAVRRATQLHGLPSLLQGSGEQLPEGQGAADIYSQVFSQFVQPGPGGQRRLPIEPEQQEPIISEFVLRALNSDVPVEEVTQMLSSRFSPQALEEWFGASVHPWSDDPWANSLRAYRQAIQQARPGLLGLQHSWTGIPLGF